ncbi:hypothetical protein SAMN02910317_00900 [Ruminococcaceae bacterium FB2012]|nr:hypothetical protein SAMN02910317_00900 [Ruminococcaceae bacterium FB2012]
MDAKKIYEIAKESVVKIKAAVPSYSAEEGMEFCVIADADGNLFSAMTNITVKDNSVERIPADIAAFLYMKNTGSMVAKYIIVLSVADRRIIPPSEECFDLMFRTNSKNDECVVVLSSSEQKPLSELRLIGDGTDFLNGFDFVEEEDEGSDEEEIVDDSFEEPEEEEEKSEETTAEAEDEEDEEEEEEEEEEDDDEDEEEEEKPVKAPADKSKSSNFISGVEIDESNPFYAAPTSVKPPEEVIAMVAEGTEPPAEEEEEEEMPQLSKEELLKQAKKRKKVARANFLFRKRK